MFFRGDGASGAEVIEGDVGGGGIPVVRNEQGDLVGTAAVIDKDLASERLAEDLDADALLILTAVEQVCLNYGKPNEKRLSIVTVAEAEQLSRNACMERALAWYLVNVHRREVFSQMRQGYREMAGLNLTLAEESLPLECECESMGASVEILTWSRQTR